MIHIKHFHKNGNPNWDIKLSPITVGIIVLLALALITNQNTAGWISSIIRK
jgi:hypothetical protein